MAGGSALILGKSMSDTGKTLFVADTFEGVVNSGPNDNFYRDGEHADATAEDVIEFLNLNLETDVKVLVGEFPLVTGHLVLGDLSLVHIDVDVYESGRQIFEWCAPRLSPNGVIIFDDYGFFSTNGINTLVNEILETGEFLVFYNLNGHAILTKRT